MTSEEAGALKAVVETISSLRRELVVIHARQPAQEVALVSALQQLAPQAIEPLSDTLALHAGQMREGGHEELARGVEQIALALASTGYTPPAGRGGPAH